MGSLLPFDDQLEAFTIPLDSPHGEAVVQVQGCTETVEAWSDVGCGGWDIHHNGLAYARLRHPY